MLLIGSQAAALNGVDLGRSGLDYDLIIAPGQLELVQRAFAPQLQRVVPLGEKGLALKLKDGTILELEVAYQGTSSADLLRVAATTPFQKRTVKLGEQDVVLYVAPPEVLLALKLSHRYKRNSPHFLKTMRDVKTLRAVVGQLGPYWTAPLSGWIKKREKETYTYAHPKLNQDKKSFFSDDDIQYVYDHDSIHEALKHRERPAYTYFSEDGQEVKSSKLKFLQDCDQETRLLAVLEESQVLAIERSQVPFNRRPDVFESFRFALEKVCTSITSGWFREFAWEHYDEVVAMHEPDFVDRFFAAAEAGQVKPYNSNGSMM